MHVCALWRSNSFLVTHSTEKFHLGWFVHLLWLDSWPWPRNQAFKCWREALSGNGLRPLSTDNLTLIRRQGVPCIAFHCHWLRPWPTSLVLAAKPWFATACVTARRLSSPRSALPVRRLCWTDTGSLPDDSTSWTLSAVISGMFLSFITSFSTYRHETWPSKRYSNRCCLFRWSWNITIALTSLPPSAPFTWAKYDLQKDWNRCYLFARILEQLRLHHFLQHLHARKIGLQKEPGIFAAFALKHQNIKALISPPHAVSVLCKTHRNWISLLPFCWNIRTALTSFSTCMQDRHSLQKETGAVDAFLWNTRTVLPSFITSFRTCR